jgi:hypothetical protein
VDNPNYTLRIMDDKLVKQVAQGRGDLTWQAKSGTWYVAVCPNPDAPEGFQLRVFAL